jgi:uncharacterized coiled-coil protein SlyX
MDEYRESNHAEPEPAPQYGAQRWLVVAAVVLLCIAGVSFVYGYHQQSLVRQLSTQAATSSADVNSLQNQVNTLTAKLSQMTTPQPAPTSDSSTSASAPASPASATPAAETTDAAASATTSSPAKRAHTKRPSTKRRTPPVDAKYNKLQAQVDEQQKQLKDTQDAVEKNRSDLEGSLNSTRDDLNGSIARTHEELVSLEKRGERSFFEFDLSKSKQFSRVGPVTLSLRKADTKHKNYNLAMIVDDDQLQKKNVNLFEPIWIHTENEAQPVQIVVNKIGKDSVHGYVSAPKYKPSELAANGSAAVTPVSAKTPATTPNPPDQQQPQPPPPQQPEQPLPF